MTVGVAAGMSQSYSKKVTNFVILPIVRRILRDSKTPSWDFAASQQMRGSNLTPHAKVTLECHPPFASLTIAALVTGRHPELNSGRPDPEIGQLLVDLLSPTAICSRARRTWMQDRTHADRRPSFQRALHAALGESPHPNHPLRLKSPDRLLQVFIAGGLERT